MNKLNFKYKLFIFLINIISKTWRFQVIGDKPNSNGVLAFWHGNMLPVWRHFYNKNPIAVVSQSKDGEILSHILKKWNYELARGSSSKGGKEILNLISEKAKEKLVLITPDGPRGPYHKFKAGAVIAAQRSQSSLYLCKVYTNKKIVFSKSWDKFEFPFPFTNIKLEFIKIGEIPIEYSKQKLSEIIVFCETRLNDE
mgnify:CR=1 FL=1